MTKQQQQLYALGGIGMVLVGVLGYYFRDKFMPMADATDALPPAQRLEIPTAPDYKRIFGRADFGELKKSEIQAIVVDGDNPPKEIFITP